MADARRYAVPAIAPTTRGVGTDSDTAVRTNREHCAVRREGEAANLTMRRVLPRWRRSGSGRRVITWFERIRIEENPPTVGKANSKEGAIRRESGDSSSGAEGP